MAAISCSSQPDSLTLFIIIDAFRHDFLSRTRYLASIADWRGEVRETFGFISTRPAMCAGLQPDQTGICFEYRFAPDGDTFRPWLFKPLGQAARALPARWLALAATLWIRGTHRAPVVRRTAWVGNMPLERLPLFDYTEKCLQTDPLYLEQPTIYDHLRRRGERFLYYGFARPKTPLEGIGRLYSMLIRKDLFEADRTMVRHFIRELPKRRPHLAHLHFSVCDWVGHRFGPDSPQMREAILFVDRQIELVHRHAASLYANVRLLASADHGMVAVEAGHDLAEVLRQIPFSEPEDYVSFLDSTMARFWFFRPSAYHAVQECLDRLPWGRILDDEDRRRHRLEFADNRNGDLFFMLKPGHVLLPNYYQGRGNPPRGMHGYEPDTRDNMGAILIHNPPGRVASRQGETVELTEVFQALLDLHQIPHKVSPAGHPILTT